MFPSFQWNSQQNNVSFRLPSCEFDIEIHGETVDTARCVDIHHYPPPSPQIVETEKPKVELKDVTLVSENLVMSTKGTRVLMDLEDYSKEKQTETQKTNSELPDNSAKPRKIEKLGIFGIHKITEESIRSILSLPFYLLFSQSPLFIQLTRSLVLNQNMAYVSLTEIPGFLLPFTSNCCYLFVESIPALEMEERDCSDCVNEGSTDLFAFWNHQFEQNQLRFSLLPLSTSESLSKAKIPALFPGDLSIFCYLRKLSLNTNSQSERPEETAVKEIRGKLLSTSLDAIESGPKFLHMGDVSMVLKSQIKDLFVLGDWMIGRYSQTIGMMNEEVSWFFKQMEAIREEYREDFSRMNRDWE